MATYTAITDAEIDQDSPITQTLMTKYRDNLIATAEGASGAPSISANALQTTATEVSWVAQRTATIAAGDVGSYAFAWLNSTATPPVFGATVAGSSLRPAGFTSDAGVTAQIARTIFVSTSDIYGSAGSNRSAFSGTWRCMGEARQDAGVGGNHPHTLWLRIQ
jgi:hypothetical protein